MCRRKKGKKTYERFNEELSHCTYLKNRNYRRKKSEVDQKVKQRAVCENILPIIVML